MTTRLFLHILPALVAQSLVHQTGDQDVVSLIPAGFDNIHLQRLIIRYFLRSSLPLIQEEQLSDFGERMCTSTGSPLKGLRLPWKKCG